MSDPAETALLHRAVTRMRELANRAQPGPWHVGNAVDPTQPCNVHTFPDTSLVADGLRWPDAEHIAAWNPKVTISVAGWLRAVAIDDEWEPESTARLKERVAALMVARAFLGEPE